MLSRFAADTGIAVTSQTTNAAQIALMCARLLSSCDLNLKISVPMLNANPPFRFPLLLASLFLLLILPGLVGQYLELALPVMFVAIMVASLYLVAEEKKEFLTGCVLAVPMLLTLFDLGVIEPQLRSVLGNFSSILFLAYVCRHIFSYLFNARKVASNVIYAALCLYMILGFIWAFIYSTLDIFSPGSVGVEPSTQAVMSRFSEMLYFSFVTITTLGYGDISPVSQLARSVAVIQGIIGQVYLAVVVARLVGMQISEQD